MESLEQCLLFSTARLGATTPLEWNGMEFRLQFYVKYFYMKFESISLFKTFKYTISHIWGLSDCQGG